MANKTLTTRQKPVFRANVLAKPVKPASKPRNAPGTRTPKPTPLPKKT